jgi:hypothetical protein
MITCTITKVKYSLVLVAHVCNPSYSRGRDQEGQCSKLALASSSGDPISKNPSQKCSGGVDPDFKPQYWKKKKKGKSALLPAYLDGVVGTMIPEKYKHGRKSKTRE